MTAGRQIGPWRVWALLAALAGVSAQTPDANGRRRIWEGGAEIRGRFEANTALGFLRGHDDSYYLHRLRLSLGVAPRQWLRFYVQAQDSRAPGYTSPVPASLENTLDLRQWYVELGSTEGDGWGLRAGRQELSFGEERLIGESNWSNVGRSFDALRLSYASGRTRLDWFTSSVVTPAQPGFDRPRTNNKFHGFYSSFGGPGPGDVVQPYILWKSNTVTRDEAGARGDLDVPTLGVRATGALRGGLDYGIEMALQRGHAAGDDIRAWAGHWLLGYTLSARGGRPRAVLEYNYATGDQQRGDRVRGSFDQLYPTNHSKYGIGDRIGWRNIHDAMAGLDWRPRGGWRVNLDLHGFWLATRQDALYTESGVALARNPGAASSHVGQEIDLQVAGRLGQRLQLGAGVAHLFPGRFLREVNRSNAATFVYLFWTYGL